MGAISKEVLKEVLKKMFQQGLSQRSGEEILGESTDCAPRGSGLLTYLDAEMRKVCLVP